MKYRRENENIVAEEENVAMKISIEMKASCEREISAMKCQIL